MRFLRWIAMGLALVVGVVAVGLTGARLASGRKLRKVYPVRELAVPAIPQDEAALAEGERLWFARGCADCHGADGGGKTVIDDPVVGKVSGSNLTTGRGGVGASMRDLDFVRAVRHCVRHDGISLLLMPCEETGLIPDDEIAKILAHVRRMAPVDRELPLRDLNIGGHALIAAGKLPLISAEKIDFDAVVPPAPPRGPTADYGERLARIQCVGCHGEGLSGGPVPGLPPGMPVPTNITVDPETGIGRWTQAEFVKMMRTGKRPDGTEVNPFMPWNTYRYLEDDELEALWTYLRSRPARPFGNR